MREEFVHPRNQSITNGGVSDLSGNDEVGWLSTIQVSDVKPGANILAESPAPESLPLLVSMDVGKGRSILVWDRVPAG